MKQEESLGIFSLKVQWLHYNAHMPVIERFPNCRVRINANDHPPPHFHVLMNDGREAWIAADKFKELQR